MAMAQSGGTTMIELNGRSARLGMRRLMLSLLAVLAVAALAAPVANADIDVVSFDIAASADEAGAAYTQAGGHPFDFETSIGFGTRPVELAPGFSIPFPVEDPKDISVELPPGVVGNPSAMPKCRAVDFFTGPSFFATDCPHDTQVGIATLDFAVVTEYAPVYNLDLGRKDVPAVLGFDFAGVRTILEASVRSGTD